MSIEKTVVPEDVSATAPVRKRKARRPEATPRAPRKPMGKIIVLYTPKDTAEVATGGLVVRRESAEFHTLPAARKWINDQMENGKIPDGKYTLARIIYEGELGTQLRIVWS